MFGEGEGGGVCVCLLCASVFFFLVPSDTLYILPVYSGALFLAFLFIKSPYLPIGKIV